MFAISTDSVRLLFQNREKEESQERRSSQFKSLKIGLHRAEKRTQGKALS
jgi:hypothetical protein